MKMLTDRAIRLAVGGRIVEGRLMERLDVADAL